MFEEPETAAKWTDESYWVKYTSLSMIYCTMVCQIIHDNYEHTLQITAKITEYEEP